MEQINNKTNSFEYECDFCHKPESEVGNLYCGRNNIGRDYQFCKLCKKKYNIAKVSDIEQVYKEIEKKNERTL